MGDQTDNPGPSPGSGTGDSHVLGARRDREAQRLFEAAVMLPAQERSAFIASECSDAALAARVTALVRADAGPPGAGPDVLRAIAPEYVAEAIGLHEGQLCPGEHVGAYEIVCTLGEGGFGIVYLGMRRQPMEQHAAIKVIKPGMDTLEVLRRFESERRALALMNHPCIARVFDAGATGDGRPYVVMEYIEGAPLTIFAERHGLTARQRIELMIQVCEAVQHAHSKGIIHRDLKPANILVVDTADVRGSADQGSGAARSTPIPKIIDFGVARVILGALNRPETRTAEARQVGTPAYMSPEQLDPQSALVDARTDVYSLGVVLYELLCGVTPFGPGRDARGSSSARASSSGTGDPPRPETRLRVRDVESGSGVSNSTGLAYLRLSRSARDDLQRLFVRAMEPAPEARYATAMELADDLRNFLQGLPLRAARLTWQYRTRKFIKRNRELSVLAVVTTLALLGLLTAALITAGRERELRATADQARAAATKETHRNQIAAAQALLAAGDAASARAKLERVDPSARGWEWRVFWNQVDPCSRVFGGHSAQVSSARFSPDGAWLVSGAYDHTMRLWDVATGRELHQWQDGYGGDRACADFSPDGAEIVVGGHTDSLWIYDTRSRQLQRRFPCLPLNDLRWSPDGRFIALASRDERTRLIDPRTGDTLRTLEFGADEIECSADGRFLAMRGESGTPYNHLAVVYNTITGERVRDASIGPSQLTGVCLNRDGSRLALCGGANGAVFSLTPSSALSVFAGDAPCGVQFAGTGDTLVAGGRSGSLHVWGVEFGMGESRRSAGAHALWVYDVSRDGDWVVTASGDNHLRLWSTEDPNRWIPAPLNGEPRLQLVASSFDARIAAFSYRSDRLVLRDLRSNKTPSEHVVPLRRLWAVAFSPDPNVLFLAGDGIVARYDLGTRSLKRLFGIVDSWVHLEQSPDRSVLVAGCRGQAPVLYNLAHDQARELLDSSGASPGRASALSPDARVLACIDDTDFRIRLVDINTGHTLRELWGHTKWVCGASFSPDGRVLASGSFDGTLHVWEVSTGRLIAVRAGVGYVGWPVFIDQGQRVVAGDQGGFLRVWDTADWEEVASPRAHPSWCGAKAIGDGETVVTVGHGDGYRVWRPAEAPENVAHMEFGTSNFLLRR